MVRFLITVTHLDLKRSTLAKHAKEWSLRLCALCVLCKRTSYQVSGVPLRPSKNLRPYLQKGALSMRIMVVIVLSAVAYASSGLCQELNVSEWSFKAPIDLKAWPGEGLVECPLPPEVSDRCKPDLSDLRVVSDAGQTAGYAVRLGRELETKSRKEFHLKGRLYNRSHVRGRESTVTVDFGERVLKNRLKIVTAGTNFRRKTRIEGSDDSEKWMVIREGAFLFRVDPGADKVPAYSKNSVSVADNDQRYLRITVFNAEDDKDVVEITDVAAVKEGKPPASEGPPAGTTVIPAASTEVVHRKGATLRGVSSETDERKRVTDIILDLGFRNMLLYGVKLEVEDRKFFRPVQVSGRDEKTRVIRRPVEDSPAHEKTVEVPWRPMFADAVYRYSSGQDVDQSLDLALNGASARHLRITIENGDDPPLNVKAVTVYRVIRYVQFVPGQTVSYALIFGNPKAVRPVYDIGHYMGSLRKEGVTLARLGEVTPNPAHRPAEKVIPWSERHKEIIWIALLAMGAVLLLLVYRLVKAAPKA